MTKERITEHTDSSGNTHTTRTIETGDSSGGGAAKWVFLIILVAAIAVAGYFLTRTNASEIARNNAITEAANEVGDAAGEVGNAAQEAGQAASDAVDKMSEE